MTITCRICGAEYDYEEQGSRCPQCATENEPFRSVAGRQTVGRGSASRSALARHARLHETEWENPYTKRRGQRRTRPYLSIVVFAVGVTILGTMMMRAANDSTGGLFSMSAPQSSSVAASGNVHKKPIAEYASTSFQGEFQPNRGVTMRVNYTGVVALSDVPGLELYLSNGKKCVFIDVYAHADTKEARKGGSLPGRLFLRTGTSEIEQFSPAASRQADFSAFTPMSYMRLTDGSASGQVFFLLDESVEDFTLCWYDSQKNVEQQMKLRI